MPLVDTIEIGAPIGLSSIVDLDIAWRATEAPQARGSGSAVDPTDPAAFSGQFAAATCRGTARAKRTGFSFNSLDLDATGFFAEIGTEQNGSFLT